MEDADAKARPRLRSRVSRWRVYRKRIFDFFETPETPPARLVNMFVLATILFSICCLISETSHAGKQVDPGVWFILEAFSSIVFTAEYAIRLAVCKEAMAVREFVLSLENMVDLVSIVPFYLELGFKLQGEASSDSAEGLRVFRAARLVRLFRLFRSASSYSSGLKVMVKALRLSFQALWVLVFWTCIGVVMFSSCVFFTEKLRCPVIDDSTNPEFQEKWQLDDYFRNCLIDYTAVGSNSSRISNIPEDFAAAELKHAETGKWWWQDPYTPAKMRSGWASYPYQHYLCCTVYGAPVQFPSIFETFWWTMVTMTCVGYGDYVPYTWFGQVVATMCMISGILLISLPTAIVGAKFQQVYQEVENESSLAPYTGRAGSGLIDKSVDWSLRPELGDSGNVIDGCVEQEMHLARRMRASRTEQHVYTTRLLAELRGLEVLSSLLQAQPGGSHPD